MWVFSRARTRSPRGGPVPVRQDHLRPLRDAAQPDQAFPYLARQPGGLFVGARQEEHVPAQEVVRQVERYRFGLGLRLGATADPAPGVVGSQRSPLSAPELEGGQPFPFGVEPAHLGQLPVAQIGRR